MMIIYLNKFNRNRIKINKKMLLRVFKGLKMKLAIFHIEYKAIQFEGLWILDEICGICASAGGKLTKEPFRLEYFLIKLNNTPFSFWKILMLGYDGFKKKEIDGI